MIPMMSSSTCREFRLTSHGGLPPHRKPSSVIPTAYCPHTGNPTIVIPQRIAPRIGNPPSPFPHPLTSFPLPLTSFPHPPTSFPHPPTSFPHPPTSFPHPPTSFPRRRESPVAPRSQRSRRIARSCRPPAVMPRDRTEPATAAPMLRGDSRPHVDHRGCDVEECRRMELRANCSRQGMKAVQDMIYCLDFSKKQRSALRRTTSPIRTDGRGWSQQE